MLLHRDDWVTAKSIFPNGLASVQEFFFERQSLAHDRLNLGAWAPPNEVIFKKTGRWNSARLRLAIPEGSSVWVLLYGSDASSPPLRGLRMSRDPKTKSGLYSFNNDKMVVEFEPLAFEFPEKIDLQLAIKDKVLTFSLHEKELLHLPAGESESFLALRSGFRGADVLKFEVDDSTGTYIDDFSPLSQPINLALAFFLMLLTFAAQSFLFRKRASVLLFFAFVNCASVWVIYVVDKEVIAEKYIRLYYVREDGTFFESAQRLLEIARRRALYFVYDSLGSERNALILKEKNLISKFIVPENTEKLPEAVARFYRRNNLESNSDSSRRQYVGPDGKLSFLDESKQIKEHTKAKFKIAYMGGSQTYGGGVADLAQSFPSRLTGLINACGVDAESFNFSAPGEDSTRLLARYQIILQHWKPDLLLVNLSHNERSDETFYKNLTDIAEMNRADGIKTVFIKEPNSIDAGNNPLLGKYRQIDRVASAFNLPTFDLNTYINSESVRDRGLLWWDLVHFDSAGHKLTADWLFLQLRNSSLLNCPR